MRYKLNTPQNHRNYKGENFEDEPFVGVLPSRVPKLKTIMETFLSGRPLDSSLDQHLGYNPIENNPLLAKGVDLADLPKIAKSVGQTMEEVNNAVENAKVQASKNKEGSQVSNPVVEQPIKVE